MSALSGMPEAPVAGSSFELRLRAQVLASLYAAGATLVLLTVVLPHPAGASATGLLAIVVNAYVIAGAMYTQAQRLRPWTLRAMLAWGTTLITGVAYFSDQTPSPLVFFYLWIFLYSAYFFTKRQALLQIGYAGLAYGLLLLVHPPGAGAAAWWIVGMGAPTVAAFASCSISSSRGRGAQRHT